MTKKKFWHQTAGISADFSMEEETQEVEESEMDMSSYEDAPDVVEQEDPTDAEHDISSR